MNILEKLNRIDDLPTIPTSLVRIMNIARDPNADFQQLAGAVETDQTLAAKILKVANSPVFGGGRDVPNLERAVMMMGFNEVRRVALGLTAFNSLHRRSGSVRFDRGKFWVHSYACAFAAKQVEKVFGYAHCEDSFVAGLLHDIGKVVLDCYFPQDFADVIQALEEQPHTFIVSEKRVLGAGHNDVGSLLLERWDFPGELLIAVSSHHDPDKSRHPLSDIVYLANLIVHQIGVHSSTIEPEPELDNLAGEPSFASVQKRSGKSMKEFLACYRQVLSDMEGITDQVEGMA